MPTWTHAPPDDPRDQGLPLIRTPATGILHALVTSPSLAGTDTHFWGGHTVPCERPECDACEHGIGYRWHGYLTAFNPADQLHFIFEMTAQAAKKFAAYQKEFHTLRCCEFEAYRWHRRKNGRVIIKTKHSAYADHALPRAPDIETVMAVIWRLPLPNVFVAGVERALPKLNAISDGDGQSADPKLYDTPQP